MNDDDHLSLVECNEQSEEEQPHDDDILVSELDLERSLSHLSNWNLCPNNHQEPPRNDSCNVVAIPHQIFGQGDLVEELIIVSLVLGRLVLILPISLANVSYRMQDWC